VGTLAWIFSSLEKGREFLQGKLLPNWWQLAHSLGLISLHTLSQVDISTALKSSFQGLSNASRITPNG
jgi:hypothetical protein